MAPRCLPALAAIIFLFLAGCADDAGPEPPDAAATELACEEWVRGFSDYVAGAKGSKTLAEALVPHVGDVSPEIVERKGARVTVVVREGGEVVANAEARKTRRGWLVDTITRCTEPRRPRR